VNWNSPQRQALVIALASGVAQVSTALLYAVAARGTPIAQFGYAVSAIALGTAIAGVFDFGTTNYWVREIAAKTTDPRVIRSRAATRILVVSIACIGVGALLSAVGAHLFAYSPLIAIALTLRQVSEVGPRAALASHLTVIGLLWDRGMSLAIFFVGRLWLPDDSQGKLLCWSLILGPAFGAVVLGAISRGDRRLLSRDFRPMLPWRGSLHFGIFGSSVALQNLDVSLLSSIAGPAAAGAYGAVSRWTQPMTLLANSVAVTNLPLTANAGSGRDAVSIIRRSAALLAAALLGCMLVALASTQLVAIVLGDAYSSSADILRLMCGAAAFIIINQPLASLLQARRDERFVGTLVAGGVAVHLGTVAVLGSTLGAVGAGWALIVVQASLLLGLICRLCWRAVAR